MALRQPPGVLAGGLTELSEPAQELGKAILWPVLAVLLDEPSTQIPDLKTLVNQGLAEAVRDQADRYGITLAKIAELKGVDRKTLYNNQAPRDPRSVRGLLAGMVLMELSRERATASELTEALGSSRALRQARSAGILVEDALEELARQGRVVEIPRKGGREPHFDVAGSSQKHPFVRWEPHDTSQFLLLGSECVRTVALVFEDVYRRVMEAQYSRTEVRRTGDLLSRFAAFTDLEPSEFTKGLREAIRAYIERVETEQGGARRVEAVVAIRHSAGGEE